MSRMWMVRAGTGGRFFHDFKEKSVIAIGWPALGSLEQLRSREDIFQCVARIWPNEHVQWQRMSTSQLFRFRNEMAVGDRVVTYDASRRMYLVGTVSGDYRYDPTISDELPNIRPVRWDGEVSRNLLSTDSRNVLGAISTLFLLSESAAADIERALKAPEVAPAETVDESDDVEESLLVEDVQGRAIEFIKDKITRLDWRDLQNLVAGLLRAMGYKTRVSGDGADRGKDIIASPDGFGFESPRIVVEVKHRTSAMGSQEIRSFLGGRHSGDKGLYVSTGGFTKDARYEADRASIPVHLMDSDDLVEAILDHYDALDGETKQLLPLRRVYWPI